MLLYALKFRKLLLGEYRWLSYEDVDQLVDNVGRGMRMVGCQVDYCSCYHVLYIEVI